MCAFKNKIRKALWKVYAKILHNEEGNRNVEGLKLILFKEKILNIWKCFIWPRNFLGIRVTEIKGHEVYVQGSILTVHVLEKAVWWYEWIIHLLEYFTVIKKNVKYLYIVAWKVSIFLRLIIYIIHF